MKNKSPNQGATRGKNSLGLQEIPSDWYKAIIKDLTYGYTLVNHEGNILDANETFCRMTGYSYDELLSMKIPDIVVEFKALEEEPEKIEEINLGIRRAGGIVSETQIRRKDGGIITIMNDIKYLDIGPGLYFDISRDITEQKRTYKLLQDSEEKLRLMFESVDAGITVSDLQGNILQANNAAAYLHGYKNKKELIGLSSFKLIAKKDRARALNNLNKTLNKGHGGTIQYTFLYKDGSEFISELNASTLKDGAGKPIGFIAITRDISERKKIEKELEEYRNHLEELVKRRTSELVKTGEKLEEQITQRMHFTRALVHELKTPLTPLLLASDLLTHKAEDEVMQSIARTIRGGADALEQRINELLDIAMGEIGMLRINTIPCNLLQLIKEVCQYMSYVFSTKKQSFSLSMPKQLHHVEVDAKRIRQVLINLLDNASKYTPQNGSISLRVKKQWF